MIAIYIRVSTDEQAQHGTSLDSQKDRGIAYCISQGWENYQLYIDDGYTGTNTNRPALKRLLRHIEENKISTVIVYKLDRLGRKQLDVLNLLETFDQAGVTFKSVTEPFDTGTPLGKAMIGILAVFAQLERDMIIERVTEGRRKRASEGRWYGGRIPFGYFLNPRTKMLEIVPEEAEMVRAIYNRYLQGYSRLSIAEWASERTKARVFDHSTIRDMLQRPLYMGKLIVGDKLVDGQHEPIIDSETWYKVQYEISRRREELPPRKDYLLTGLLECGVCGSGVIHVKRVTRKYGKVYLYELYACRNQHVREKDRYNFCTLGYRRRIDTEEYVVNEIKSIALNPNKLKGLAKKQAKKHKDESIETALLSQLEKINQGLENLYDAIQNGIVKASAVAARIRKLEEERESIETRLDEINEEDDSPVEVSEILVMAREIREAWDFLTDEEQKLLVRKMIKKVIMMPDKKHEIIWNVQ